MIDPRLLQRVHPAVSESLDRGDVFSGGGAHMNLTRAGRGTIDMDGARSAKPNTAAEFCSGQSDDVANDPQERHVGGNVDIMRLTVDLERDQVRSILSWRRARQRPGRRIAGTSSSAS